MLAFAGVSFLLCRRAGAFPRSFLQSFLNDALVFDESRALQCDRPTSSMWKMDLSSEARAVAYFFSGLAGVNNSRFPLILTSRDSRRSIRSLLALEVARRLLTVRHRPHGVWRLAAEEGSNYLTALIDSTCAGPTIGTPSRSNCALVVNGRCGNSATPALLAVLFVETHSQCFARCALEPTQDIRQRSRRLPGREILV